MKRVLVFVVLALVMGGGACVTQARLEKRVEALLEKWAKEHPGQKITDAERAKLSDQAAQEIAEEVKKERAEALAKAGETAGNFATGNIIGGILGLIGLGGLGYTAVKKARGEEA